MNDPILTTAPSYGGNEVRTDGRSPVTEPPYDSGPAPSPTFAATARGWWMRLCGAAPA
jgi:hypothetical protein